MTVIAVEEHYWDAELASHFKGAEASRAGPMEARLRDFGGERIADMDRAGIGVAVLSHGAPSGQKLPADIAVPLVARVNDRLAAAVAANPARFAAFAALPTAAPEAAADELERCVAMGFKGAMLHGMSNGEFLDLPKFWPIYARAERLDVPVYLHPSQPHPAVADAYYNDYARDFPMLPRPAWGYTGESLPFQLWRIDGALSRAGQKPVRFREVFTRNFWVTTSGFFSTPALLCCLMELGADRILFAVDWPFVDDSAPGVAWAQSLPLSSADRDRILHGNAERLLKVAG